ncbi:CONSERVED SERINE PROLINE-RICH PROTEIN [Salix viminalis]|uniref:CONSERVED SERINE PROLINE-RICH PROTEIN n=1 Tax=Salix viminalis TaxID=40686 RepID=A0A9Q0NK53_SALVM|nr:CONSERVED SERINE PROLINE-RICH PROTEIN [Salix viminalis]
MSVSGIQGQLLQVTVAGCTKLKDTEWISRQDPYVCVEYGSQKCRTRTCKDGGKNPTFQEKFMFTLIEGLREISVGVWNSNTLSSDDFIGNGKIQLQKVLSQGFDDTASPLQTKTGRYAGEVRLIMHYANASKAATGYASSAPPCVHSVPGVSLYNGPASAHGTPHAQPPSAYPVPSPYPSCPPDSSYPPSAYPPPQPTAYPPAPYPEPSAYRPPPPPPPPPPQTSPYYPPPPYPPPPQTSPCYPPPPYPPPPQTSPYYPPGPFFGTHPPPPY